MPSTLKTSLAKDACEAPDGMIYMGLGYSCNSNCVHCVVGALRNKGDMTTEEVLAFFEGLRESRATLELSGGEPALRPDFLYLMKYLSRNCPRVNPVLFTNARPFASASLASGLADFPPRAILVPIQGDGPGLHDRHTRVRGSLVQTLLGMRNLLDHGMNTLPKTIITRLNYKRLPSIVEFVSRHFPDCSKMGVDTMDLLGSAEDNMDWLAVRLEDMAPWVERAVDAGRELGVKVNVSFMPFCAVGEEYRSFISENASLAAYKAPMRHVVGAVELTRGPVEKCAGCRYQEDCPGTWHSYFRAFGTDEIKPVM